MQRFCLFTDSTALFVSTELVMQMASRQVAVAILNTLHLDGNILAYWLFQETMCL